MISFLLNGAWLSRLNQYNQLIVGFSGGLDSTVLLHLLASQPSLRDKLVAVHVHHGISPNADQWQAWCEQFCLQLRVCFLTYSVEFDRNTNIEEGARNARYVVFSSLLNPNDGLILGHHLDDQAETVLLQMFRGAGVDGLAAMSESSSLGAGEILRPLLSYPRGELYSYANLHGLTWVQDESNEDTHYARNYLRHEIMPLLVKKWPGVVGNIARAARHCDQAKTHLSELALQDCPELASSQNRLFIGSLKKLAPGRIVNVLRTWLKNNEIQIPSTAIVQRIVDELLFAHIDAQPEVTWGEVCLRRYQEFIYLDVEDSMASLSSIDWSDFPNPLNITPKHTVSAYGAQSGLMIPHAAKISIRFRQGGELFIWHGQTKQLKKLFQEWKVPPWLRDTIPLLYINNQLAAVVGYAVSDAFYTEASAWRVHMDDVFEQKMR